MFISLNKAHNLGLLLYVVQYVLEFELYCICTRVSQTYYVIHQSRNSCCYNDTSPIYKMLS